MIKRIGLLVVVALMAVMMLTATAMPAMAAPYTCWDGSTPTNDRGTKECPPEPGKNENQPKFYQQESQKGSFSSSHPTKEDCGEPCPPGQFK